MLGYDVEGGTSGSRSGPRDYSRNPANERNLLCHAAAQIRRLIHSRHRMGAEGPSNLKSGSVDGKYSPNRANGRTMQVIAEDVTEARLENHCAQPPAIRERVAKSRPPGGG